MYMLFCWLTKKAFKGNIYQKAEHSTKDISFEITEDDYMGLSKVKTKAKSIGKLSAEKIGIYQGW